MQQFTRKYLGLVVLSCVAGAVYAEPEGSEILPVDEPATQPSIVQPDAQSDNSVGTADAVAGANAEESYSPFGRSLQENTCCDKEGPIAAAVLEAALLAAGLIHNHSHDLSKLPALGDLKRPGLVKDVPEVFRGAVRPNELVSSATIPSLVLFSSQHASAGASLLSSLLSSSLVSSLPILVSSAPLLSSSSVLSLPLFSSLAVSSSALLSSLAVSSSLTLSSIKIVTSLLATSLTSSSIPLSISASSSRILNSSLFLSSASASLLGSLSLFPSLVPLLSTSLNLSAGSSSLVMAASSLTLSATSLASSLVPSSLLPLSALPYIALTSALTSSVGTLASLAIVGGLSSVLPSLSMAVVSNVLALSSSVPSSLAPLTSSAAIASSMPLSSSLSIPTSLLALLSASFSVPSSLTPLTSSAAVASSVPPSSSLSIPTSLLASLSASSGFLSVPSLSSASAPLSATLFSLLPTLSSELATASSMSSSVLPAYLSIAGISAILAASSSIPSSLAPFASSAAIVSSVPPSSLFSLPTSILALSSGSSGSLSVGELSLATLSLSRVSSSLLPTLSSEFVSASSIGSSVLPVSLSVAGISAVLAASSSVSSSLAPLTSSAAIASSVPLSSSLSIPTSLLASSSAFSSVPSSLAPLTSSAAIASSVSPSSSLSIPTSLLASSSASSGLLSPTLLSLSTVSLSSSIPTSVSLSLSSVPPIASSSVSAVPSYISLTSSSSVSFGLAVASLLGLSSSELSLPSSAAQLLSSSGVLTSLASSSSVLGTSSIPSVVSAGINFSLASSSGVPAISSILPSQVSSSSADRLSSSLAPSSSFPFLTSSSVASSVAPIASTAAPIISTAAPIGFVWSKLAHPSRSPWKYGFHTYDYGYMPKDFEFRNLVTFGDSLSDTGSFGRGSIYLAGGNPYEIYNSYLSLALTGKLVTPERFGGANYAMSGSVLRTDLLDPLAWITPRDTLDHQVSRYLKKNGGYANKDDAFVIWGGGNDITQDIQFAVLDPLNWGTIFSGPKADTPYLNDKALYPGKLAQQLIDHGAQGPILVMNIPSSAYTSFTGVFLPAMFDSGILTANTPFDIINIGGHIMTDIDKRLRDPSQRVGRLMANNGIVYLRENNINALHKHYWYLPTGLLSAYYDLAFNLQNNVINWFNNAMEKRVARVKGDNVVLLDVNALFKEVVNNPLAYGINEILVPECRIGVIAPNCDEGDNYYHGEDGRQYMYTDWHHPSKYMHRIIAEYAIATLNAPAYVTGLSRAMQVGLKARQDFLLGELNRINARPYAGQGDTYAFGGYSGGLARQKRSLNNRAVVYNGVNIGYGYRPSADLDLGAMLSLAYSKVEPHRNFKFNQEEAALTLFAQYSYGPAWFNAQLTGGTTRFDDINRSIPLGKHVQTEKGDTTGRSWGVRLEAGFENSLGGTWVLAPFAALTKNRYEVKGYEEKGNSSTAMRFNKQSIDQEYATLGLRISDDCLNDAAKLRSSVDLTINKNIGKGKHDRVFGEGGLKHYSRTFKREVDRLVKNSDTWGEIKPTVQYTINKHAKVTTSVSYSIDGNKARNKNLSYSVGYRYNF